MDKQKALTILGVLTSIAFACGVLVLVVLDGRGNNDSPIINSELDTPSESIQDNSETTTELITEYEYDREITISGTAIVDRNPDDFIVSDVQELDQKKYYTRTDTSFSNSIVVQSTKYITVGVYTGESIECVGDDGVTTINVSEINPLDYTPEKKKEEYLNEYWQAYIAYEGKGFIREDTELDIGLKESADVYNKALGEDPTVTEGMQLLTDSKIETAIGEGYILVEYSQYSKKFTLHAYIDCGYYRYLEVTINSINEDTLIGYLHDLINNGVYIIE